MHWKRRERTVTSSCGLVALSITTVVTRSRPAAWVFLALSLALALLACVDLGTLIRATRAVLVVAVLTAALQWMTYGPDKAAETLIDLMALAAVIVTATAPVNAMQDAVIGWMTARRRFGVDPERVALTFTLAMQALPGTSPWPSRHATPRGRAASAETPALSSPLSSSG